MDYMTWDHKTNPYSTLDNGSKYTLTGKPWLEVYNKKQGLTWQDLKPEPSTEHFRFGDTDPIKAEMTVQLPCTATDIHGVSHNYTIMTHVVGTDIPLLLGMDTHEYLNICTEPLESTCKIGHGRDRYTYDLITTESGHWAVKLDKPRPKVLQSGDRCYARCYANCTWDTNGKTDGVAWKNARVIETNEDGTVLIIYTDYGNMYNVDIEDIVTEESDIPVIEGEVIDDIIYSTDIIDNSKSG